MSSTSFFVLGAADERGERVAEHFEAGFQHHERDDEAHGAVDVQVPEVLGRRHHQRAGRQHCVIVGIDARGDEGLGVRFVAEALEHDADGDLREDGHHDDGDSNGRVAGGAGVDDLVDGLAQGDEAGHQDNDGDDDTGEVFHATVAEGVVAVGPAPGELGAHDGDDGGQGVGGVVDAVQDDGDGMGHEPDGHLEGDEQRIADNAVDARLDDFPLAVHDSHP